MFDYFFSRLLDGLSVNTGIVKIITTIGVAGMAVGMYFIPVDKGLWYAVICIIILNMWSILLWKVILGTTSLDLERGWWINEEAALFILIWFLLSAPIVGVIFIRQNYTESTLWKSYLRNNNVVQHPSSLQNAINKMYDETHQQKK